MFGFASHVTPMFLCSALPRTWNQSVSVWGEVKYSWTFVVHQKNDIFCTCYEIYHCKVVFLFWTDTSSLYYHHARCSSQYVASNFRATYARNVFPCFDEPQFQVPLVLSVLRPSTHTVVFTTARKTYSKYVHHQSCVLRTFI